MYKLIYVLLLLYTIEATAQVQATRTWVVHDTFKPYFDNCGLSGSTIVHELGTEIYHVSDTTAIYYPSLPASTFKIINMLIALETGVIKSENDVVIWDGKTDTTKYGYRPEIYHDMSIKEAFQSSAGWVFIKLAEKIGKHNYLRYLKAANYGNLNLSEKDLDFWNFGEFGISSIQQIDFLEAFYTEKLPFSAKNCQIVKKVMLNEKNNKYTLSAKTGWTRADNTNTGWWVGFVEKENKVFFFATRLLQNRQYKRDDFGQCRKEITYKILKNLSVF